MNETGQSKNAAPLKRQLSTSTSVPWIAKCNLSFHLEDARCVWAPFVASCLHVLRIQYGDVLLIEAFQEKHVAPLVIVLKVTHLRSGRHSAKLPMASHEKKERSSRFPPWKSLYSQPTMLSHASSPSPQEMFGSEPWLEHFSVTRRVPDSEPPRRGTKAETWQDAVGMFCWVTRSY